MYSTLLNKEIIYQTHATHRGLEREISAEQILEIIDDKYTKVKLQKNGRIRFEKDKTIVIGELKNNCVWIITVYKK